MHFISLHLAELEARGRAGFAGRNRAEVAELSATSLPWDISNRWEKIIPRVPGATVVIISPNGRAQRRPGVTTVLPFNGIIPPIGSDDGFEIATCPLPEAGRYFYSLFFEIFLLFIWSNKKTFYFCNAFESNKGA